MISAALVSGIPTAMDITFDAVMTILINITMNGNGCDICQVTLISDIEQ
jgi:hypothetical protein